jgi:Flp pilus assembly protein TadD
VRPWLARVSGAVLAIWILALGTLTWHQVQIWRDSETLWRYATDYDPGCSICHNNLAMAFARAGLFQLAKEQCLLSLAIRPDRVRMHASLGLTLQGLGDFDGAVRHLHLALARYPNDPDILTNLAVVLLTNRRPTEAFPYLERAQRVNPNHVPSLVNLGLIFIERGQPELGIVHLLRANTLQPDEPTIHLDMARAYLALGRADAAREQYGILRQLDARLARSLEPELQASR